MPTITLNYGPLPHQIKLHTDPSRFKVAIGGRRSGKTKSSFQELLRHALTYKNSLCWWVSPTYNEAREVGFSEFEAYEEQLSPAIALLNKGIMRVVFKNGSKIYFKGADRKDSLRGRGIDFLSIDEFAFLDEETWTKVLRPALADKQGKAILTSTPNGRNWAYNLVNQIKKSAKYNYYHWTSYDNPLVSHEEIADLKEALSTFDFRQEILAEFVTKSGQVYDDFSDDNIVSGFTPDTSIDDIYIGADFGYANPSAIVFMAVNRLTGSVTQFAEIYKSRTNIKKLLQEIIDTLQAFRIKPNSVKYIYTDPAGNAEELTSGESPVDVLRTTFPVINKGSQIAPGLSLVRSYILNMAGKRKFFIDDRCKESIRSMFGYIYAPSTKNNDSIKEEPLKDGINDHACDAIRYFFVNCFPQNRYVADTPETTSYLLDTVSKPVMKRCATCGNPFVSKTPKDKPPFLCPKCSEE